MKGCVILGMPTKKKLPITAISFPLPLGAFGNPDPMAHGFVAVQLRHNCGTNCGTYLLGVSWLPAASRALQQNCPDWLGHRTAPGFRRIANGAGCCAHILEPCLFRKWVACHLPTPWPNDDYDVSS